MNPGLVAVATLLALFAITFSFFNPQALFSPPHVPGSKDHLHAAQIIHLAGAVGPESLVFDAHGGGPYTGVADGRILKWEGEKQGWTEFAFTSSNRYTIFIIIYGSTITATTTITPFIILFFSFSGCILVFCW